MQFELLKNILIVEDVEYTREILKEYFEEKGFKVDVASNGNEAFDLIKKKKFKLIITDILMPECDGIELLKKISQYITSNSPTPIVFMSGGAKSVDAETALKAVKHKGKILKKPFTSKDLDYVVSTVLPYPSKTGT